MATARIIGRPHPVSSGMTLTVGPHTYSVIIASRPTHGYDPRLHDGFCVEREKLICIFVTVPPAERMAVLRHEALHAHEYTHPIPEDPEARTVWMTTKWIEIDQAIAAAGGADALAALLPIDDDDLPASPPSMFITVGPYRYDVVIFNKPLYGRDPAVRTGFTCEADQKIYISAMMPKKKREHIFRHEAIHAWEFHLPPASGCENRANWMSTVWASVDQQINAQGGWGMFESLPISEGWEAPPTIEQSPADRPLLAVAKPTTQTKRRKGAA